MVARTKDKISNAIRLVCVVFMAVGFYQRITSNDAKIDTSQTTHKSSGFNLDDPDFQLAKDESLGFFDDIPSRHWKLLKQKVADMSPNYNTWYLPHPGMAAAGDNRNQHPGFFYQNHYEPEFVCMHERRIGKLGDGGKWICDPHRITKQDDCLVYSIGSNNDFTFEQAVLRDIGHHCEIHTFDFGAYEEGAKNVGFRQHNGQNKTAVNYHRYGLGLEESSKFKTLQTIVNELGHKNRIIDVFKIDCEGCELTTASCWFEADVTLRQILVETHKSDVVKTPHFFDILYENEYVIFHKEPNIAYSGSKNTAVEFALLKLSKDFHSGYHRAKGITDEAAVGLKWKNVGDIGQSAHKIDVNGGRANVREVTHRRKPRTWAQVVAVVE